MFSFKVHHNALFDTYKLYIKSSLKKKMVNAFAKKSDDGQYLMKQYALHHNQKLSIELCLLDIKKIMCGIVGVYDVGFML